MTAIIPPAGEAFTSVAAYVPAPRPSRPSPGAARSRSPPAPRPGSRPASSPAPRSSRSSAPTRTTPARSPGSSAPSGIPPPAGGPASSSHRLGLVLLPDQADILACCTTLHSLIGNMGWSIIALTLVIKALVFPLARKSYVSMARMKELQPEMEKLKETYRRRPMAMQQGMMKLYKENKVNPAAGCLPILHPDPDLLLALQGDLRHHRAAPRAMDRLDPGPVGARSVLDPEPVRPAALGHARNRPRCSHILSLGVLPILLGISMWLQQKLNPAPADPTQKMIFAWMPWVFMFMLGQLRVGPGAVLDREQHDHLHPAVHDHAQPRAEARRVRQHPRHLRPAPRRRLPRPPPRPPGERPHGRARPPRPRRGPRARQVDPPLPKAETPDAEAPERGRLLFAGPVRLPQGRRGDGRAAAGRPAGGLLRRPVQRRQVDPDQRADRRKALARASNTPGRTQEINFFTLGAGPLPRGGPGQHKCASTPTGTTAELRWFSRRPLDERLRPYVPGGWQRTSRHGVLSVESFREVVAPVAAITGERVARLFGVKQTVIVFSGSTDPIAGPRPAGWPGGLRALDSKMYAPRHMATYCCAEARRNAPLAHASWCTRTAIGSRGLYPLERVARSSLTPKRRATRSPVMAATGATTSRKDSTDKTPWRDVRCQPPGT